MGDVVDLRAKRAARGEEVVVRPGYRLAWDARRRIAVLEHVAGHELDAPDGEEIVAAVLDWIGLEPEAPYGFVVRGADDSLGTVAYRQAMAGAPAGNRAQRRTVMWGGTPRSRFLAETYLKGNRFTGAVFELEADAYRWLAEQGIG